jgi:hypothetical protein
MPVVAARVAAAIVAVGLAALSYGATYSWASTYGGGGPFWALAGIIGLLAGLVVYGMDRMMKVATAGTAVYMVSGLVVAIGAGAVGVWVGDRERDEWLQPELMAVACDGAVGEDLLHLMETSGEVWPQFPGDQPMVGTLSGAIGLDYPSHWCWAQVEATRATVVEVARGFGWEVDDHPEHPARAITSLGVVIEFGEDFIDEAGEFRYVWLGAWLPENGRP